jgi:hypothetical protein
MPDAPPPADDAPTSSPAAGNPLDGLQKRIRFVCLRIVRGQHARTRVEVRLYYLLRIVSIVLAALAGAGLIADKVNTNLTATTGWGFWGALLVLSFGILVQIADVFGVERVATHARVLADICDRYETELGILLEDPYPSDSLEGLAERVKNSLLDPNNHVTLPKEADVQAAADRLASELIRRHRDNWAPPPPPRGRKR